MKIEERILELEKEISKLPKGKIVNKTVKGYIYSYHRGTENGKRFDRKIKDDELEELKFQIELRLKLEQELKDLKMKTKSSSTAKQFSNFNSTVRIGKELNKFVEPVLDLKKRYCYNELIDYLYNDVSDKVFIIYGLRRTGKTTMIRQAIGEMTEDSLSKTAFVQIENKDSMATIKKDLIKLESLGYKYVFIDEVTLMEDFVEGAALFSDIFASSGMKIVLCGTDSLGFMLSQDSQLYDRCIMLHTTFISYKEFQDVLGIDGIDEYIKYGGTMSISGRNYNTHYTFESEKSTSEYVDTAIARNIQHSLKCYQDGSHFRSLEQLYENNELTNAINRVVEDINHRFTLEVLTRPFKSSDLSFSARNLRSDRENPNDILDEVNIEEITQRLMKLLDVINKENQSVEITEGHTAEIKEYLDLLDLTIDVDVVSIDSSKANHRTIITQPGMRYCQVEALIESLLQDEVFMDLSLVERNYVLSRVRSEVIGRMLEDIVLLETKLAFPNKKVFKLQFAIGEFDMVVFDRETLSCDIYEIKHSKEQHENQYRHLIDEDKCKKTEFRFGTINKRSVLYRGEDSVVDGVKYKNVENYLLNL